MEFAQSGARPETKRRFELIGGHPAVDLVNTLDWRFEEEKLEELLTDYGDLVRFAEQSGLMGSALARRLIRNTSASDGAEVVAAARALREASAQVLYAALDGDNAPASALPQLESWFNDARRAQRLRRNGVKLSWDLPSAASLPELPLWLLSLSAAELLTSDDMDRLRACGNAECRWLFLDTSKNHTRRWCDMKICGNRIKARRFKAQHRQVRGPVDNSFV